MHDRPETCLWSKKYAKKNMTQMLIISQNLGEPGMLRALEIFKLFMSCSMAEIGVYKLYFKPNW